MIPTAFMLTLMVVVLEAAITAAGTSKKEKAISNRIASSGRLAIVFLAISCIMVITLT